MTSRRCEGGGILTWPIPGCGRRARWSRLRGGCATERLQRRGSRTALRTLQSEMRESWSPQMTCKAQDNLLLLCTPYLLFTLFPIASLLFLKHASPPPPPGHSHMLIPWNVLPPLVTWLVPKSLSGLGSNVNLSGRPSLTVLFKAVPALPTLSLLYFST